MLARITSIASLAVVCLSACAPAPAAPETARMREAPPPWDAPRDAVSYIEDAGLPQQQSSAAVDAVVRSARLTVIYESDQVMVPANVGVDLVRAVEAPLHTHADDGVVYIEGQEQGGGEVYTLGQFFDLWGVRFDDGCLADACGEVTVTVDDVPVDGDVRGVEWRQDSRIRVEARR